MVNLESAELLLLTSLRMKLTLPDHQAVSVMLNNMSGHHTQHWMDNTIQPTSFTRLTPQQQVKVPEDQTVVIQSTWGKNCTDLDDEQ